MAVKRLNAECIFCLLNKYLKDFSGALSKEQELEYIQGILRILADSSVTMSAPEIVEKLDDFNKEHGMLSDFSKIKSYFNKLMLTLEREIETKIEKSSNPLKTAVKYAMAGNFIDFGAMENIDEQKLKETLNNAQNIEISDDIFNQFEKEMSSCKHLVYLTDNCGEIVFDKLLIKQIIKINNEAKIDVIVRGKPVLNDCTIDDAKEVGIDKLVSITSNGTGIAGTVIEKVSLEARKLLDNADVIISKGQGNFETMYHCNKNVYYLFLCKCKMFAERFGVKQFTGMFINDSDLFANKI